MSRLGAGRFSGFEGQSASGPDPQAFGRLAESLHTLHEELGKTIVGQRELIDDLLTAMLASGHALMVGVPGLAKTLMVQTIAKVVDLEFSRIQFTPDLMPADITGAEVIQQQPGSGERSFHFVKGPVFANIVLADEINRTPPKTQAALLQAMQEQQVTVGGRTHELPSPFFVLATQNPIEQEGTYPLPEAQLDRFMFMLKVEYPPLRDELAIVKATAPKEQGPIHRVLRAADLLSLQHMIQQIPISDHVALYCVKLGRASRPDDALADPMIRQNVTWGLGPRAMQHLARAARARAGLAGQFNVTAEHVRQVAPMVMRHRIIPSFQAEAEGLSADAIVSHILQTVSEPSAEEYQALAGAN